RFDPTREVQLEFTPTGRFKLWAVGQDRVANGGTPGRLNRGRDDSDIVWRFASRPAVVNP
ncbi:MAG: hypothetical protein AAF585_14835, partial [Verrucomicrobiota bacterium]